MNLKKVIIHNYRSIKDAEISFDHKFLILVGINESGKTNILNAIALLSDEIREGSGDIRVPIEDEADIDESYVRFVFSLSDDECLQILESVDRQIYKHDKLGIVSGLVKIFKDNVLLRYVKSFYCEYDLVKRTYAYSFDTVPDNLSFVPELFAVDTACPDHFIVSLPSGESVPLKSFKMVESGAVGPEVKPYLRKLDSSDLWRFIVGIVNTVIEGRFPEIVYWKYSEEYLLPSQVSISTFCSNPESCKPLLAMFELYGIQKGDVAERITQVQKSGRFGLRNLINNIAKVSTSQFRAIWSEYANIRFDLTINGDYLEPSVKDMHNHYEMLQRSDGFKRFITFLLMISFRSRASKLKNSIILVDEPDVSLHPTGIRFLRDELVQISQGNYVVASTHSIFMIDEKQIDRHLIVKKNDEITSVSPASDSNFKEEEVLYNALGFSVFSVLKKDNISF